MLSGTVYLSQRHSRPPAALPVPLSLRSLISSPLRRHRRIPGAVLIIAAAKRAGACRGSPHLDKRARDARRENRELAKSMAAIIRLSRDRLIENTCSAIRLAESLRRPAAARTTNDNTRRPRPLISFPRIFQRATLSLGSINRCRGADGRKLSGATGPVTDRYARVVSHPWKIIAFLKCLSPLRPKDRYLPR